MRSISRWVLDWSWHIVLPEEGVGWREACRTADATAVTRSTNPSSRTSANRHSCC
jgi:hypothetical protein